MNTIRVCRTVPLFAALLLGAPLGWAAVADPLANTAAKAGTMKLVHGDVRIADTRGERALEPGDTLAQSDRVVTGPDGAASMVLRDGTTLMIGPKSRVTLDTFEFNSTTQEGRIMVKLARGSLRMVTGLISHNNQDAVAVMTPTATIGSRGTDFIVEVDEAEK